jgi:hypothetical protein
MAHLFVPLVPGSSGEQAQNAPASAAGQTTPFKNLVNATPAQSQHANHAPKISVQRDGDKITKIQITCTCNQVIELDCIY